MRSRSTRVVTGLVVVLVSVTACGGGDGTTRSGPTTSSSSSSSSSSPVAPTSLGPSTMTPAATLKDIPIYYIAESRRSFKLYREFRVVADAGGAVASAVSAELSDSQRRMVIVSALVQAALQPAALRDLRHRTPEQVNVPRWVWAWGHVRRRPGAERLLDVRPPSPPLPLLA